ncbi:DUF4360 domain-containing protein [Actinosynnema sp. NPDC047251]|uniref:DUF4360 domain-containing protein n=1 Tax=Saccharothrix espanaensis TaxID=103731 RepID=UPI000687AE7C|nr:DUF4360 domain-containing protein [Saccharothrix espanaensis]
MPDTPGRVEVVAVNGSGCPSGTAEASEHGGTFSVTYDAFVARAGGGADPVDARKNCHLGIRADLPPGYTYGLARTSYTGYAHLEAGATALNQISFYFQGSTASTTLGFPYRGPMSEQWRSVYRPAEGEIDYSPCGDARILNINAELRVDPGSSNPSLRSYIRAESSQGSIRARHEFVVKPC